MATAAVLEKHERSATPFLIPHRSPHLMMFGVKNISPERRAVIEEKKALLKSLVGIIPADMTLEEAREERLSRI